MSQLRLNFDARSGIFVKKEGCFMNAVKRGIQVVSPPTIQGISKKTVLLVDSDSNMRLMLEALLAEDVYQVNSFGDALEASRAVEQRRFDFVITAHSTLGIDGLSLLEAIKQRDAGIPVLVISSRYEREPYITAMNLGALDYFVEPIDYAAIWRLIRNQTSA
jgi:two-component system nitrogen regulation response regulator NtrX